MQTDTAQTPKRLKRLGKTIFRSTDRFFGACSRVPDVGVWRDPTLEWCGALEQHATRVRSEADALARHLPLLPTFQDISRDQARISPDSKWRVVMLRAFGLETPFGRALCPDTAALLDQIPDVQTAFFSVLAPGKHIPRHSGVTRALLRAHLGLSVPDDRERCWMDVDGERVVWGEGEVVVFDDTRPHEVWNDTTQPRSVLLVDVVRPMNLAGRALYSTLAWALRRSPYVQQGLAHQRAWEAGAGAELLARVVAERTALNATSSARSNARVMRDGTRA